MAKAPGRHGCNCSCPLKPGALATPAEHPTAVDIDIAWIAQQLPHNMSSSVSCVLAGWKKSGRLRREIWSQLTGQLQLCDADALCLERWFVRRLREYWPLVQAITDKIKAQCALTPATIVDLCSGPGLFSMLLAQLLPPDKVDKLVLIDTRWPLASNQVPKPNQFSREHIECSSWPISVEVKKCNIKKSGHQRDLKSRVLSQAKAIVLCAGKDGREQ